MKSQQYLVWDELWSKSRRTNIGVNRLPRSRIESNRKKTSCEIGWLSLQSKTDCLSRAFVFFPQWNAFSTDSVAWEFYFRITNDFKIIRNSMYLSMNFFRRKLTEHWSWHKLNIEYNFSQRSFPCFSYKEAILEQSATRVLFNNLSSTLDFSRLLLLTFHTIETRLLRCRKNISIET